MLSKDLWWLRRTKKIDCNAGDLGSIPGSPGGGHGSPLQYSCLENPHGQRSLVSYSPWGRNELDTTERLSTAPYVEPYVKMLDLIDTVKLHPGLDCQYVPQLPSVTQTVAQKMII